MFFSTRKRSVVLAAPLLLFSIACTSEVGTTPTTVVPTATPTSVAPADTPTPTTVPPTATSTPRPAPVTTSTLTPTLTLQNQLLQELVVLRELVAARATATALTPTPTVAVPVQWQLQPLQPLPMNTPTPTPMAGSPAETGNRVGERAPDFTLTEISTGQPVQLAQLTEQGRPVVIYFFTTW